MRHKMNRTETLLQRACQRHMNAIEARTRAEFQRAETLGREALALIEKVDGSNHPDAANILLHLAGTSEDQAHYAEAERRYGRALQIMDAITEQQDDLARIRFE